MKKNTLIQLVIIYVGIMALYTSVSTGVVEVIETFVLSRFSSGEGVGILVVYLGFALFGYIIIVKSGSLSEFISERAGFDDSLTIFTKPNQLLSILIIVLALGHLLDHLPQAFKNIYLFFNSSMPQRHLYNVNPEDLTTSDWVITLLHLLLPCLLIIFCRNLTDYFSKNIVLDDEDIVAVHETIELEGGDKPVA